MKNKTFVIIPAYNEAERMGRVIAETKKYCPHIIVVDDGSQDKTFQIAQKQKVVVLRHKVNLGKGAALKTGSEAALNLGAQILVFLDADGQHKPEDIPRFIRGLEKGYDLVFGIRKLKRPMPCSMLLGNKLFSILIHYLYDFKLPDTQCGFRAFWAAVYPQIAWQALGYEVETEIIVRALQSHLKCGIIFIDTVYYDQYKGTTIIDGLKVLAKIIGLKLKA